MKQGQADSLIPPSYTDLARFLVCKISENGGMLVRDGMEMISTSNYYPLLRMEN
jgi:hypothetical protein